MSEQAADVYRVEADWERVSWLGAAGRLISAAFGGPSGSVAVVRIIDTRTSAVVKEHKWESMVSTEAEYEAIKERLKTMSVAESEEAYSLGEQREPRDDSA